MVAVSVKLSKNKALFFLIIAAVAAAVLTVVGASRTGAAGVPVKGNADVENYIASFGIIISGAAREDTVTVPMQFGDIYKEYNELQRSQGFDLSGYKGKVLSRLTYPVKSENGDNVFAEVLLCDGIIVGADVYSTSVTGFMKALK